MTQQGTGSESPFGFIGRKIREIRKEKGWTQTELGQKLERRKLSRQAIGWIESGRNTDLETIADIAAVLGVGLGDSIHAPSDAESELLRISQTLVDVLLRERRDEWPSIVEHDARYLSATICRELIERWEAALHMMPADAVAMARAALVIAQKISSEYPAEVMASLFGAAWRQYSFALFYTGEHQKALEELDRARAIFERYPLSSYDLARINIGRALIYSHQGRYEEAFVVANQSRRTFLSFGDRQRVATALSTEAYILLQQSRYGEALRVLRQIDRRYKKELDRDARTRLIHNIALCHWHTGNVAEALREYEEAAALDASAGNRSEAARGRMSIAGLLASEGHYSEAKRRLSEIREEFRQLGMNDSAVFADLMRAEILLVEGNYAAVEEICSVAIQQYQRTGMAHSADALTALGYLREAAAQDRATPETVRHVKEQIERLGRNETVLFAPPPLPPA